MKEIKLTQDKVALVDDEDYEQLIQYKWQYFKSRDKEYASRVDKNRSKILMHRQIMKTPKGLDCDHEDGNGLNNQRYNLRNCTRRQNLMNKRSDKNTTSKYKGVSKHYKKWIAHIKVNSKVLHLGSFTYEDDAALAYNWAAKKHFGEFAKLNIIKEV